MPTTRAGGRATVTTEVTERRIAMTRRWTHAASIGIIAASLIAGGTQVAGRASARVSADDATATATASPTPGFAGGDTATPAPSPQASATPGAGATATPTIAVPHKPINPTPIPSRRHEIALPKPIVVVLGTRTLGTGLNQKAALTLANSAKNLITFLVAAPSYVPKNYILQLIQLTPAQDQQTPAQAVLQYIPKGLSKVGGTFPSLSLYKQLGQPGVITNPCGKLQTVTVRPGKKGVGIVKGQLADIRCRTGNETILISWSVAGVQYELASVVSLSRLSQKDLIAVAGSYL